MIASLGWMDTMACRDEDPEIFFGDPRSSEEAKAICARCPVTDACLNYVITQDIREGVAGGLSETERFPLHAAHIHRVTRALGEAS
jgi:WhiB family transcriptional regulator, redox-sensing transcriptional regulator